MELKKTDPIIFHFRMWKFGIVSACGGATVVYVPKLKRFGVSVCSKKDIYSKKRGRIIAVGRACSRLSFCEGTSEVPVTMELVRRHATQLAQVEATPILGEEIQWVKDLEQCNAPQERVD